MLFRISLLQNKRHLMDIKIHGVFWLRHYRLLRCSTQKNGLPIDEDKEFDYSGRYKIVNMPVNYDGNNYFAQSNGRTLNLHLNREPRFFAWIAFHNGNYEIMKYNGKVVNTNNAKRL